MPYRAFQHIKKLMIFSLNFTTCAVKFATNFKAHAVINQCVFTGSERNYAITIFRTSIEFNISVNNSMFLSNSGAISCDCGRPASIMLKKFTFITISNTKFLNNTSIRGDGGALSVYFVHIRLDDSSFINNTAIRGGAVRMKKCSAIISNTCFLNNSATYSGGAISLHSGAFIKHCIFARNHAKQNGGAIDHPTITALFIEETHFLDNYVMIRSGGAIYSKNIDIHDCQFKSNYAAESGGAVYVVQLTASNLSLYLNKAGIDGGAIFCKKHFKRGSVHLHGCSATMNSAKNGGFLYSLVNVFIRNACHIVGNKAIKGGGDFFS